LAKSDTIRTRLPRGTKPVVQAFFDALEAIPERSRADVAKAAYAGIRDAMKDQREKSKLVKAAEREAASPRTPKAGKAPSKKAGRPRLGEA
jgi:hypothetical protein